jgi:hypothetical protein
VALFAREEHLEAWMWKKENLFWYPQWVGALMDSSVEVAEAAEIGRRDLST